jgi:glucosamine--fructose-6-phosphate aminotransferase (isomerizing)
MTWWIAAWSIRMTMGPHLFVLPNYPEIHMTTPPTTDSAMYQTIQRQPADMRGLLTAGTEQIRQAADLVEGASQFLFTGVGTSYHAALAGQWLFRWAGFDAVAINSADLWLYPEAHRLDPNMAVIVMAHTGARLSSAAALRHAREADATAISVGSSTAEHEGSQLILRTVERETSAAYTSSHLCAMTVLAQLAIELAGRAGTGRVDGWAEALATIPDAITNVLAREDEVAKVAARIAHRRIYATGAGPSEVSALELVIKAREAALAPVDGLPLEQFMHGPMVAVNEGDALVLVRVPGAAAERSAEAAMMWAALGVDVWVVGDPVADLEALGQFRLPELPEPLSLLLTVVPMQLLAYNLAVQRGTHPDTFRRDDPRYAEAFGMMQR